MPWPIYAYTLSSMQSGCRKLYMVHDKRMILIMKLYLLFIMIKWSFGTVGIVSKPGNINFNFFPVTLTTFWICFLVINKWTPFTAGFFFIRHGIFMESGSETFPNTTGWRNFPWFGHSRYVCSRNQRIAGRETVWLNEENNLFVSNSFKRLPKCNSYKWAEFLCYISTARLSVNISLSIADTES